MINLYILANVIFIFDTFTTMAECQAVEQRLQADHAYTEYQTLCLKVE
jgi:uncharacterized protein YerC